MSLCCDLDLEDTKHFFPHETLAATPFEVWQQNVLRFRRYHPDKHSPTFRTFAVTLTLNAVTQFFQKTLRLMMLYYQTKFGRKRTSSLEDRVEIVMFLVYQPSLWPWLWRQKTNISAWHSGSWCCITTPSLVSKWSAVSEISPGQTFTNILTLCCDLDLERSNPIFA